MIQDLFPPSARVNRIVPKRTFIDKLGANARMKEHFTRDVVSIEWFAKMTPSTLNIADGLDVHEIAGTLITSDAPKLEEAIEQTSRQEALLKEIAALEKKIAAEPQPHKKFLLHKQLTELKKKQQQWNYKNDNLDNIIKKLFQVVPVVVENKIKRLLV